MKILLVSLLLISCGIDEEKDTDDQKDPSVSEAGDLASEHPNKTIFSFVRCNKDLLFNEDDSPAMGEDGTQLTHSSCSYHRIAENDDCGTAGDQCQITVIPETPQPDADSDRATLGWPVIKWQVGCTCSKEKLSQQQTVPGDYRCAEDKCSLNDLQEEIVKKATRNGKPTSSDNKFSKLEKDLLKDMIKDAFDNLPNESIFADYFKEDDN